MKWNKITLEIREEGGAAAIAAKEDFVAEARASLMRAPAFSISGINAFVASKTAACSSILWVTKLIKPPISGLLHRRQHGFRPYADG